MSDGQELSVADYFYNIRNKQLVYPDLPCVEVGSGVFLPIELCVVPPGQIMRKQVPPGKVKDVLEFATKVPAERLKRIEIGLSVLAHGESEYVKQFGMHLRSSKPLEIRARILPPPTLKYGSGSNSKQAIIVRLSLASNNFFNKLLLPDSQRRKLERQWLCYCCT